MDKIKIKREWKNVVRDLEYYKMQYELNDNEAYELLHENYYIRMKLTQGHVGIEEREAIYKRFKDDMQTLKSLNIGVENGKN